MCSIYAVVAARKHIKTDLINATNHFFAMKKIFFEDAEKIFYE